MKYLLDTHILIWLLTSQKSISTNVLEIIKNRANTIYVSSVSLWEISIKLSLGKLDIGEKTTTDFVFECEKMNFDLIDLTVKETATFYNLKNVHHKDPFDRILIWQAIKNDFTFISDDKNVKKYVSEGLKVIG
jgi:PIN domain nuclease of toxin-antitoxin system